MLKSVKHSFKYFFIDIYVHLTFCSIILLNKIIKKESILHTRKRGNRERVSVFPVHFSFSLSQGIQAESASFLLSIIGITNTIGRVFFGYIADFPSVNSLLLNNLCLVVSTLAVGAIPLCLSYFHYVIVAVFFGTAVCEYWCIEVFQEHTVWVDSTFVLKPPLRKKL